MFNKEDLAQELAYHLMQCDSSVFTDPETLEQEILKFLKTYQ